MLIPNFVSMGKWYGAKTYWAKDYGVLICRNGKWWASNDIRWDKIGTSPNKDLVFPTVGPYSSHTKALQQYKKGMAALNGQSKES